LAANVKKNPPPGRPAKRSRSKAKGREKKGKVKKATKRRKRNKKDAASIDIDDDSSPVNAVGAPVQKQVQKDGMQDGFREYEELVVRVDGDGTVGPPRVFSMDVKHLKYVKIDQIKG
jgi:hypothetical protein